MNSFELTIEIFIGEETQRHELRVKAGIEWLNLEILIILFQGMKYMLGEDWLNLFDVVIVSAKKPNFFKAKAKQFRIYSPKLKRLKWKPVLSLEQGLVYTGVRSLNMSSIVTVIPIIVNCVIIFK